MFHICSIWCEIWSLCGSGSKGGVGVVGERPSKVHSQFNQLINPNKQTRFVFGSHT